MDHSTQVKKLSEFCFAVWNRLILFPAILLAIFGVILLQLLVNRNKELMTYRPKKGIKPAASCNPYNSEVVEGQHDIIVSA